MHDVLPVHQPLPEAGDHTSRKRDRGTDHDREVSEEINVAEYRRSWMRGPDKSTSMIFVPRYENHLILPVSLNSPLTMI